MTWQKLARSLADAIEYVEFTNDLGIKDRIAMSCLTVQIGEMGTFLQPDNDQLISFLIRVWDGQRDRFRHETVGSGAVEIDNPWLNFIAATTPTWLRANFPDTMIGGGLTSRLVFVYGDKKRELIPYPDAIIPDGIYKQQRADLVSDLVEIGKLSGPYHLSPFAREWGEAWYKDHNNPDLRPQHLSSTRYDAYLARKQTHLHKLAIILAAAKRSQLVIEESDLEEAEQIINLNEKDMLKVFESIGVVHQSDHIHEIVSIVRFHGFMTSKGLWARSMMHMTLKEFKEAVEGAVHGRLLEVVNQNGVEGVAIPLAKKGPLSA
jgi:Protein of unknown function (DUF3987)